MKIQSKKKMTHYKDYIALYVTCGLADPLLSVSIHLSHFFETKEKNSEKK